MIKMNNKTYKVMWQGKKYRLPTSISFKGVSFNEVGAYRWQVTEDGSYEITLSGGCTFVGKPETSNVYKQGELVIRTVTLTKGDQTTIQIGNFGNNKYTYKTGGKNGTWHTVEEAPSGASSFTVKGTVITAKGASGETNQKHESNNNGSLQQGYCFIRRVR